MHLLLSLLLFLFYFFQQKNNSLWLGVKINISDILYQFSGDIKWHKFDSFYLQTLVQTVCLSEMVQTRTKKIITLLFASLKIFLKGRAF